MNRRSPDSDDIERAVYDGMQDLRARSPNPARPKKSRKAKAKRQRRRRG